MNNKKRLREVIKNPLGKTICIDLDNTLCDGIWWGKDEHPPVNEKMAGFIRELDDRGAFIVIWTARPLCLLTKTYKWLGANNLLYPIALRTKPPANLYIDDNCLNVDDICVNKNSNK